MTETSKLAAEAAAISTSSSRIRTFAIDAAANLVAQEARIVDQAARIAVLEAKLAANPTPAATPVPVGAVIFQDDFTGLDPSVWDVKNRVANLSKTVFTPANVSVHDSLLDIVATKDAAGQWCGGEIQSLAPTHQYVGPRYMEARAKLPAGYGTWPAPIWEVDAPWGGAGVENDVCEQLGKEPGVYHASVHNWGTDESVSKAVTGPVTLAGGDWHTYGAAVYPDRIDYYLDGLKTVTIPSTALSVWKFTTTPMVILIDLDMGGSWAGTPTITGPAHLLVDYVKVWKLA